MLNLWVRILSTEIVFINASCGVLLFHDVTLISYSILSELNETSAQVLKCIVHMICIRNCSLVGFKFMPKYVILSRIFLFDNSTLKSEKTYKILHAQTRVTRFLSRLTGCACLSCYHALSLLEQAMHIIDLFSSVVLLCSCCKLQRRC